MRLMVWLNKVACCISRPSIFLATVIRQFLKFALMGDGSFSVPSELNWSSLRLEKILVNVISTK